MSAKRARALEMDLEGVAEPVRDRVVLFRTLITLGGQLRGLMDRRYREDGITTQQAAVLAIAGARKPPPSQSDVARLLGVTQQNVRQLVDTLVKKRLLAVRDDPADGRIKRLVPTARSAPLFARRNPDDFEAIASWFAVLDDRETKALLTLLMRLLAASA